MQVAYFRKGDSPERKKPTPPPSSRLTPLRSVGVHPVYGTIWECICACGAFVEKATMHLNKFRTSCGCAAREHARELHYSSSHFPFANRRGKIAQRHRFLFSSEPWSFTGDYILEPEWDVDPDETIALRRGIRGTVPWLGWPDHRDRYEVQKLWHEAHKKPKEKT